MSVRKVCIDLDNDSDLEQSTDIGSDSGQTTEEYIECELSCQSKNGLNFNDIQNSVSVEKSRDKMSDDSEYEFKDWYDFAPKNKLNSKLKNESKKSITFAVNNTLTKSSSSYFDKHFDNKKDFKEDNKCILKKEDLKYIKSDDKNCAKIDIKSALELYDVLCVDKRSKQIAKKDRISVKKADKKVDKLIKSKVRKDIDKNVKIVDKSVVKTDPPLSSQKYHKKVENKSNKLIEKEVKKDVNADVVVSVPTPSTSRADSRCETSNRSDVYLPLRSVEMKDQSTDPRYYCRPSNSSSISLTDQISVASNEDTPSNNISTVVPKIWVFICLICRERFESKKQFCEHHSKAHSADVKGYQKIEKHLLDVSQPSVPKKKKRVKHRPKNLLESGLKSSDSVPKIKSKTKSKETINGLINCKTKKRKNKTNKRESNRKNTLSNANVSTDQVSSPRVFDGMNHYRLLQKCKICSFTPLVNSMKSIEEHIQKEHNIHSEDISCYHMPVMVKFRPK